MTNLLKNIATFVESAVVAFDHYADLYVIEVKAPQVVATKVDMQQFIGV